MESLRALCTVPDGAGDVILARIGEWRAEEGRGDATLTAVCSCSQDCRTRVLTA